MQLAIITTAYCSNTILPEPSISHTLNTLSPLSLSVSINIVYNSVKNPIPKLNFVLYRTTGNSKQHTTAKQTAN